MHWEQSMLRIRFAYSKLLLGNVTARNYFGISVHKRMEVNNKLLYSLSFHHRERKFIWPEMWKICWRNSTKMWSKLLHSLRCCGNVPNELCQFISQHGLSSVRSGRYFVLLELCATELLNQSVKKLEPILNSNDITSLYVMSVFNYIVFLNCNYLSRHIAF
jgi:hypothetical protein